MENLNQTMRPNKDWSAQLPTSIQDGTEESKDAEYIEDLADRMRSAIEVKDRRYHLQKYEKCFLGSEAVAWLISSGEARDAEEAVALGDALAARGLLRHVTRDHGFRNARLFYRFLADEGRGSAVAAAPPAAAAAAAAATPGAGGGGGGGGGGQRPQQQPVDWGYVLEQVLPLRGAVGDLGSLQSASGQKILLDELMSKAERCEVSPLDAHNVRLLDHVQPAAWADPTPEPVYNLVVVGAGTGGLVAAAGGAGLFAKTALVESNLMGGDCLNAGCVPSKALVRCAEAVRAVRTAGDFGVEVDPGAVRVDFGKIMERMRKLRADIAHHDSAERFSKELGVDVYLGWGKFTSPNTIEVNGKTLRFKKAVVASGARAAVPPIEGIEAVPYLTNANVFNLTARPGRLLVVGFGPIGLELAQCFARFGSQVTVVGRRDKILPKEDRDAAEIVYQSMLKDGMEFIFNCTFLRFEHTPPPPPGDGGDGETRFGTVRLRLEERGKEGVVRVLEADALLLGTGRRPNVEGMGLEAAGIAHDAVAGVQVDDHLRTSNPAVFAVGDCCTRYQFTHAADFMARLVLRNALFPLGRARFSALLVPWCTFTAPEVAHVGQYPADLEAQGVPYATYRKSFAEVDRAVVEGETEGFVKVHCKKGTDTILGATVVGPHAGDLISELSVAMQHGIGLSALASVIHPYPTRAEAIRQLGDLYNKTKLTPRVKGLFVGLMAAQRR